MEYLAFTEDSFYKSPMMFVRALLLSLFLCATLTPHAATLTTKQNALKFTLNKEAKTLSRTYSKQAVQRSKELYQSLKFQPLWQDKLFTNPSHTLLMLLKSADADGLNPNHYHTSELSHLSKTYNSTKTMEDLVKKDIAHTVALFQYLSDLNHGKTKPDIYTHRSLRQSKADQNAELQELFLATLASSSMKKASRSAKLRHPEYLTLKNALKSYRAKASNGQDWTKIPFTRRKLTQGTKDARRIPLLIKRLQATGDLPQDMLLSPIMTPEIVKGVQAFQARHGLKADGIIGRATLRALNVPLDIRIDQLQLALERWRWLPNTLGNKHLRVNIAGFHLRGFEEGMQTLTMPIVVGKKNHETPQMHTVATDVTFNPYWYIPESILQSNILPQISEDPSLFSYRNYEASIGSYKADAIHDVETVLAAASAVSETDETSPDVLRLRQRPGRGNALGRARVNILNNDSIYLHDTPLKSLFRREYRALSHGCIRLSDAEAVAHFLLNDHPNWEAEKTAQLFRLKNPEEPAFVTMEGRVPVYLRYTTAWAENGRVHFGQDVYNYDRKLLTQLSRTPSVRLARR